MTVSLVFWDIDGTLMHCGAAGTKAFSAAFRELYGIDDAFENTGIGRAMDSAIISRVMAKNSIDPGELPVIEERFLYHLDDILKSFENLRVMPGAGRLLSHFESSGAVNSLLTSNLRRVARIKLVCAGLWEKPDGTEIFSGGGFGDQEGEKWDAATKALEEIRAGFIRQFPPSEVLIIGDGVYDIETAKRCGFRSLATATGWTPADVLAQAKPDFLVNSLTEFAPSIL